MGQRYYFFRKNSTQKSKLNRKKSTQTIPISRYSLIIAFTGLAVAALSA